MTDDTKQPEDPSEENSGSNPEEGLDTAEGASAAHSQDSPNPADSPRPEDSTSSADAPASESAPVTEETPVTEEPVTEEVASGEMEPHSADSVSDEMASQASDEPAAAPEKPKKASRSKSKAAKAAAAEPSEDIPPAKSAVNGIDASSEGGSIEGDPADDDQPKFDWYILKVASNREESVRDALLRRVKIEGLEEFFSEVIVPTETISEYKGGKRRTKKQKLWPGYLVANMVINDDTWFIVRETPGIGDFTGAAGKPTPMQAEEVQRVLALIRPPEEKPDKARAVIAFSIGDRVKINEGTFQNFEGQIEGVDEANGHVTVMINIFGRSTPVELAYWQVEAV